MALVGVIVDDGTGDDGGTTRQQQHPTTPTILFFLVHFMDAVVVSDTSCWELIVDYYDVDGWYYFVRVCVSTQGWPTILSYHTR